MPVLAKRLLNEVWQRYQAFRPFSDREAWALFKLSAFAEAIGWTLLISGLGFSQLSGHNLPIQIAGRLHGTLFLIYLSASIVVSPSLRWGKVKTIAAISCSVLPYGSLAFELFASKQRQLDNSSSFSCLTYYHLILSNLA